MARLGSGHRMAEIARPLNEPCEVPASALREYPFLRPDSFTLRHGESPLKMGTSGKVSRYMALLLLVLLLLAISMGLGALRSKKAQRAPGYSTRPQSSSGWS
eukprot:7014568-Pyramimonas_sp.AAC.1